MSSTTAALPAELAARLKRDQAGLIPAVVQDAHDHRVLMVAWMNDESLAITLATGQATYWSRSRQELWRKGATSGHTQQVHRIEIDCDGDTLLLQVTQTDGACHTGERSCFDAGGVLFNEEEYD